MQTTARTKVAIAKRKKMMIIAAVAVIIVVLAFISTYTLFFSYNNTNDHFTLSLQYNNAPSQLSVGSQVEVLVWVNYNSHDHITLTTSGTGASWAGFRQGDNTLSQLTITSGTSSADLIVKVTDDANKGQSYYITITGTNSAGITSSVTYTFTVS